MKYLRTFFIIAGLTLVLLITTVFTLRSKSQAPIETIRTNRAQLTDISATAQNIADAETNLAFFTDERKQKIEDAIPSPFDVGPKLSERAKQFNATAQFTPTGSTITTGATNNQPQELLGTLKISAPSYDSLSKYLVDLETGSYFVSVKRFTILPSTDGTKVDATLDIGVFVQ